MNNPIITVVVPVYNVQLYLEKCVKSIQNQTFTNIEILLVDDGSTDNSGKLCDKLEQEDNRIRVIHKKNGGLSDARNIGIKGAKGQYIGLVDSDDYIEKDMYEILYNNLLREQADVSVITLYTCYNNVKSTVIHNTTDYKVLSGLEMIGWSLKYSLSACTKLYKKNLLLETPFIKGRTYEDALIMGKLFSKVKKVVIDYRPKYYYVHHLGTITTNDYQHKNQDMIYAFKKNFFIVKQLCPQYLDIAYYRVLRSYYEILDKIILSDNQDAKKDKKEIKNFIIRNYFNVIKNKNVVLTRKFALTILLLNENLYKNLLIYKHEKYQYVD